MKKEKFTGINEYQFAVEFSNIKTKNTFKYQLNWSYEELLSSITFFYKDFLNLKVEYTGGDWLNVFFDFENIITGKKYGEIHLEKYVEKNTNCYLMFDGINYKIGKSSNPKARLKQLKTANPNVTLMAYSPFVPEKFLHEFYAHRNVGGEWFSFHPNVVKTILDLMSKKDEISCHSVIRMFSKKLKEYTTRYKVNEFGRASRRKVSKEERKIKVNLSEVTMPIGKYKDMNISFMAKDDEMSRYLSWFKKEVSGHDLVKKAISEYVDKDVLSGKKKKIIKHKEVDGWLVRIFSDGSTEKVREIKPIEIVMNEYGITKK